MSLHVLSEMRCDETDCDELFQADFAETKTIRASARNYGWRTEFGERDLCPAHNSGEPGA